MKILVVDDSTVSRRILVHALAHLGYSDVVQASDGEQAIARCKPDVDVVFTDWNMPNRTGLDVARHVRGRSELAHVVVIMVTGRHEPGEIVRGRPGGRD